MNKRTPIALAGLLSLAFASSINAAEEEPKAKPITVNSQEMIEEVAGKEKEFTEEMENNPRYQHEKRGDEYLEKRKLQKAIEEFDAAIALDPKADTLYVKKGIALYSSGKPLDAVPLMDKAIKVSERGKVWAWWPLYHKGIALGTAGDLKGAFKSLNKSIKLNPNHENYFARAKAYAQQQRLDKALADIKTALSYKPDDQRLKAIVAHVEAQLEMQKTTAEFLKKMAAKKGAQKTDSGLIYFELKKGDGKSPAAKDKVKVHYHGTLPDGKVFDSSVDRGEPVSFPLNRVIPCWTEGLQKMQVGGKARLICPAEIAYGNRGSGSLIRPGATLAFEVELLGIE